MRPVHRDHFENGHSFLCFILPSTRKKMHFIWVSKYFARKYYLGSLFFVSNWRRDRHFTWSSEPREGLPACSAKELPSFLSYFKTLSIGRAPGIDLATSRSTIKCYSDWANPAEVNLWRFMAPTPQNRRLWKQPPGWRFLKTPASRLLVDGRKQGFLIRWCHTSYPSREYTTSITHTPQRMLSYFHRLIVLMWTSENDLNTLHVDAYLPLGNYLRQCTFVHIRQMCFLERVRQYD